MSNLNEHWLADVVILNESSDRDIAGDVSIFRSFGDAELKLEPWYVLDECFFALNGLGQVLEFTTDHGRTLAKVTDATATDIETLRNWLSATAEHYRDVRAEKSKKRKCAPGVQEAKGILPTSIEGLIAFVGFTQ